MNRLDLIAEADGGPGRNKLPGPIAALYRYASAGVTTAFRSTAGAVGGETPMSVESH